MKVAVLGASDKPDRFSYKAVMRLIEYGHQVFPIHPKLASIEGIKVFPDLESLPETLDTLSLYVGPENSIKQKDGILKIKPKRVIFNPGTENPDLETALHAAGIKTVHDCTLLMLEGKRF